MIEIFFPSEIRSLKLDEEDFSLYQKFTWHQVEGYFATWIRRASFASNKNYRRIYLHKEIVNTNLMLDHADRDKWNNTRANLRVCTSAQNQANKLKLIGTTSKYKGVYFSSKAKKWLAQIRYEGKRKTIGSYGTEEAAGRAYDKEALKYHGAFAILNFPERSVD